MRARSSQSGIEMLRQNFLDRARAFFHQPGRPPHEPVLRLQPAAPCTPWACDRGWWCSATTGSCRIRCPSSAIPCGRISRLSPRTDRLVGRGDARRGIGWAEGLTPPGLTFMVPGKTVVLEERGFLARPGASRPARIRAGSLAPGSVRRRAFECALREADIRRQLASRMAVPWSTPFCRRWKSLGTNPPERREHRCRERAGSEA